MNTSRTPRLTKVRRASGLPVSFPLQSCGFQPGILLIEDGSGLFNEIGAMLQDQGFQVTVALDADIALNKGRRGHFGVVLVGAPRLDVLAAVKEQWPGIKTMVVTSLKKPELPVQAYEMDIDDYIHLPLSSQELIGRITGLFGPGGGEPTDEMDYLAHEDQHKLASTAMNFLVEGFTSSLAMIAQSLEDIREEHQKDMGESLSEELFGIAAQVQTLSDNLRRCRLLRGGADPVTGLPEKRFH